MRKRILTATVICLVGAPALTQDSTADDERALATLHVQQVDAVKRLERLLADAKVLIVDLRRRGEDEKAELLQKAVAIIAKDEIELGTVQGANNESQRLLGDLKEAMDRMQRLLKEDSKNTEEVQLIGKRVVDTLGRVLDVLANHDELRSLEKREKDLGDVQREVRRTSEKQRELARKTREVVERTEAEKTAQQAVRDLEQLQAMLDQIDRNSRRGLAELEKQRELAARLEAMLDQQRRLRSETSIRAGEADTVRPKINRALAEMEGVARAARKAETEEANRKSAADVARRLGNIADRQGRLADQLEKRAALEKAKEALEEKDIEAAREAVAKIDSKELKDAAGSDAAGKGDVETLRRAVEAELRKTPAAETSADDQEAIRRSMKSVGEDANAEARERVGKADRHAKEVVRKLRTKSGDMTGRPSENTAAAAKAARRAADALKDADTVARDALQPNATQAKTTAKERRAAAERAAKAAAELGKLAELKESKDTGLGAMLDEAKRAMERAKKELDAAAKAGAEQRPARAAEEARRAAERVERAIRELKEGVERGGDLASRQGKVTEELESLAGKHADKQAKADALKKAGEQSKAAQKDLREGKFQEATEKQQKTIEELSKALDQARKDAKLTVDNNADELRDLKQATTAAAAHAKSTASRLEAGKKQAKEGDAKRRMEEAQARVQEAHLKLSNSLKKLRDAMPREAEQDRDLARDLAERAKRELEGLREAHKVEQKDQRDKLKELAKRQREIESAVRRLDEQLRNLNEKRGREGLQDAQSAMRESSRQLEDGESDEAERSQKRAEKSLKQAEDELNEEKRRYRNLRQNEMLFKLREELKRFRREAQTQRESLQKIDALVRKAGRVTRHINRSELRPLRTKIKVLQRNVKEKAEAIEKERAIVYTYLLNGCAADLEEIGALFSDKNVGIVPQELLGDVVRRFEMALKGLERELQDRKEEEGKDQQDGQQGGNQGNRPRPLVPPDAEIRMILVLQRTLNDEQKNFMDNRPDLDERKLSEGEKSRLKRFYHQQGSLAELFDSLRQNVLGGGDDGPQMPPEDHGEGGAGPGENGDD